MKNNQDWDQHPQTEKGEAELLGEPQHAGHRKESGQGLEGAEGSRRATCPGAGQAPQGKSGPQHHAPVSPDSGQCPDGGCGPGVQRMTGMDARPQPGRPVTGKAASLPWT